MQASASRTSGERGSPARHMSGGTRHLNVSTANSSKRTPRILHPSDQTTLGQRPERLVHVPSPDPRDLSNQRGRNNLVVLGADLHLREVIMTGLTICQ
jgi:hypothetical protein